MRRNFFHGILLLIALTGFWMASSAGVRVQFKDNDGTAVSEWMRLEFKIVNDQSVSFNLANTTLTYYFQDIAKTWSTEVWSFLVNSMQANASTITATVAAEPSLTNVWALTLKFSSGTIRANSTCWILVGVHNQVWKVNEVDDYSYIYGIVFQDDNDIALYQGAERIWGPELFAAFEPGPDFTVTTNPIISYGSRKHYSSDPVAAVIPFAKAGPVLYLATSTDKYSPPCDPLNGIVKGCNIDYPMDSIHLYSTSAEDMSRANWFEHGNINADNSIDPIFKLGDFQALGAKVDSRNMFAPEIQYVPEQNKMFMYIPMPDKEGKWQIGTASANIDMGGSFDRFTRSSSFFTINPDGDFRAPANPIDPGVFPQIDDEGNSFGNYYMMYVDASYGQVDNTIGNISMAFLGADDMTLGHYRGKVQFAPPYRQYPKLTNFMEGPDVSIMKTKSGTPYYYMVFSAGKPTALIGYAMASVAEFDNEPLSCWKFKGWIFQDFGTGNNHVDLVHYDDKYYIFYHQGRDVKGNHRRQVWCKEIELIDNPDNSPYLPGDGEIVGVTRPVPASMDKLNLYGSLNGKTTTINRTTNYIRNVIYSDTTWSYVTLATEGTYNEGVGIYNRYLTKGSVNQEWIIENVPEGTLIGTMTAPANAIRLRNMLTPERCMTCGDVYNTDNLGPNYGIFNKAVNPASPNQVWIKEPVNFMPGGCMLRCMRNSYDPGNDYYLTRDNPRGKSDTYCKTSLTINSLPLRQKWFIE